jgi:aldehyde dehydrogenase (NAD+)
MGKPSHNDVFVLGLDIMRYYAGKSYDVQGETSLNNPGLLAMSFRQPFGVVSGIIPWNTAFLMLANKVTPALAAGNTMILKSSEKSPLSAIVCARCMQQIGFPKGVLNIVSGYGRPTGEAMAKHMQIRKLAFTGSTVTGRAIKRMAAESNLKKVTLELGGKSPLIVFEDADLAKTIPAAAFSIMFNSGQTCMASSRIYVHEKIADAFVEGVKGAMTAMDSRGDPTQDSSGRGPLVDKLQFDRVMGYLKGAKGKDLEVVLGGGPDAKNGLYIEPTIIRNAPEDAKVTKEEIFGPVVVINTFADDEDVLRKANDSENGLYGSIFTQDVGRAIRFTKHVEAGTLSVNVTSPMAVCDMPFGRWKASGDGREQSKHGVDSWTELKTVLLACE